VRQSECELIAASPKPDVALRWQLSQHLIARDHQFPMDELPVLDFGELCAVVGLTGQTVYDLASSHPLRA
jgi:hypothetical protein